MTTKKTTLSYLILAILCLASCKDPGGTTGMTTDNFDRTGMLTDWADMLIIPNHETYQLSLEALTETKDAFLNAPNVESLSALRMAYIDSYKTWQTVSMFDIGRAEAIGLRNYTNIYPTDVQGIITNIVSNNYNLELPSNFDTQGFPALDYLLFGTGDSDSDIISKLSTSDYLSYIDVLVDRLAVLNEEVLTDWKESYRETFISNDGGSSTSSVDKLVNDFLFYYEKFLRAGKIGIPAGVFSGNTLSESVEAPYSKIYSKALFEKGFESIKKFFNGEDTNGNASISSIYTYLKYIADQNSGNNIGDQINLLWSEVDEKTQNLDHDLQAQVINENLKMLETYDALQAAVIIMKVDMMQALNIQVDYVDADGD